jgi:cell division protein FtsW
MSDAVANVRYRWHMGVEARAMTLLVAVLLSFGLATVYSASAITAMQSHHSSAYFVIRQAAGVAVGIVIFAAAAKIDAERWYDWAWPLMIVTLVLLLFVVLPFTTKFAPRIHGARRYLFGGSIQPSEIGKLAVIVWTSMLVIKKGPALRRLSKGLLPVILVVGALDILVYVEPDLSSTMFYTLMMGIILFAGGVRVGHFVVMAIVGIPLLYTRAQKLQYVMLRMSAFLDPGNAPSKVHYQSSQSLIAVGSGGLFGVGFGNGRQSQYGFLPFAYDDFIGGNIGEEWGFVGLAALILIFALYGWLGFRIARRARSPFQRLVAVGITTATLISAYLHLGVVISLLPNTGVTLPFISYGRSSLLLTLLMTGILVNIGSEREKVIGDGATNPLEPVPA